MRSLPSRKLLVASLGVATVAFNACSSDQPLGNFGPSVGEPPSSSSSGIVTFPDPDSGTSFNGDAAADARFDATSDARGDAADDGGGFDATADATTGDATTDAGDGD